MEQWGGDELALERRAYRQAELQSAATVLQNLSTANLLKSLAVQNLCD